MQLVEMVEGMVKMVLATTTANKEGGVLQDLAEEADLQVDVVVEAGEVMVGIMVKEGVVIHLMVTTTTDSNTENSVNSCCTT